MIMPHPGLSSSRIGLAMFTTALCLLFVLSPLPGSGQATNGRFVTESNDTVAYYLSQSEELYREGQIDAALALMQIARPLIEVPANRQAAEDFSSELRALQARQIELADQQPREMDQRASYIETRFREGEDALAAGDFATAREAFTATWLLGSNYNNSRAKLDEIEARMSTPAAAEAPVAPRPRVRSQAEELFAAGNRAQAQGRSAAALELFQQAQRLNPALPGIESAIAQVRPAVSAPVATPVIETPTLSDLPVATPIVIAQEGPVDEAALPAVDVPEAEVEVPAMDTPSIMDEVVEAVEVPVTEAQEVVAEITAEPTVDDVPAVDTVDTAALEEAERTRIAAQEAELAAAREAEQRAREAERQRTLDDMIRRAEGHVNRGDAAAALSTLNAANELDPGNATVASLIAEANRIQEREAADAAERDRVAREVAADLAAADSARAAGQFADAVRLYERVLSNDSSNLRAQDGLTTAREALDTQNRLESEIAQRANEIEAEAATAMNNARTALAEGRFDDAEIAAEEARALTPARDAEVAALLEQIESGRRQAIVREAQAQAATLHQAGLEARRAGNLEGAVANLAQALQLTPENTRYQRDLRTAEAELQRQLDRQQAALAREQAQVSRRKYDEGVSAYRRGDLDAARRLMEEALEISPDFAQPRVFLQETEAEWEEYSAARAREAMTAAREREALDRLSTRITLQTQRPVSLNNFLQTLTALSNINYTIQGGVDAEVDVNVRFEEVPLSEVLDNVLIPNGLIWERRGDFIVVMADLTTEVFSLSGDQASKVRLLIDSGELQSLLAPAGSTRVAGRDIRLDNRRNLLIVTDSRRNIERLVRLLDQLDRETPPEIIFRTFTIRERQGPRLKSLLENVLRVGTDVPFNVDRRVILDGNTLIIQDTPENVARAEEILNDRNMIRNLDEDRLGINTFTLVPRQVFAENTEQLQQFGEQVVEVIRTFLYAESGVENARREGRRLWYDPALLQLTVVDYQSNLREVADFIASLPQLAQEERFEFILLRHADANEMASQIRQFLGIEQSTRTGGGSGGTEVIRSIRTDQSFDFQDINIRVIRVNENDANDANDDSVEMVVRTPTESRDVTLEEFRSEFVGDYELTALDVRPSGTNGRGSVRLQIRYNPAGGVGTAGGTGNLTGTGDPALAGAGAIPGQPLTPQASAALADAERAANITIESVNSLNALLIRFRDVALFNRTLDLIERLDIPTPQVSINTNFVEVNETRAKEFSSEFALQNLLNDDFDFSDGDLNVGFGRDVSELRSIFEPGIESPFNAGLLKGTTDVSFNFGALQGRLRFLEAEGILNVMTGPQVTAQSGENATFEITLYTRGLLVRPETGATPEPLNVYALDQVLLDVSPTVTQLGSITLDLDVTMQELIQDGGQRVVFAPASGEDNADDDTAATETPRVGSTMGIANTYDYTIKEKQLTTKVRVQDGGTVILGGFMGERSRDLTSGVPVLRNLPYVGKVLFGRNVSTLEKTTMLIFLNANLVD